MKDVRSQTAVLCVLLAAGQPLCAQQNAPVKSGFSSRFERLTYNYRPHEIAPVSLGNSKRLDSLLRAGKIYLSLSDAIALALENNLDIEVQRYGPQLARADLARAEAGGVIRGVPVSITAGPTSAVNFVTGGFGGGTGGTGTGGGGQGGGAGAASGTLFQVTGSAIPNLDPVFNMGVTQGKNTNPQSNSFVTGVTALQVENTGFNMGLQKQFLTGTGVAMNYQTNNISTNSPANDLNPFYRGNVNLQVTQRLMQGFGRAVNNRNIRVSRNNLKVSDLVFKQQVMVTVSAVINLYWDLVSFNEDLKVRRQAVALAQKLYDDNKKQVEIGTLAPIEIVRAEAEVARTQQELTNSETQLLQQETILKNALSRTGAANPLIADARIIPTDQIRVPAVEAVLPIQDLYEQALKNRPEIEQTRIAIDNTRIGLAGARSQLLPSLDVFGSTQNNALIGSINSVPFVGRPGQARIVDPAFLGGYGGALGQILRRNFPDYQLGFQLNVPLRNRQAQADITNDTLRLRQQELGEQRQLNNIRVDVQNALIAVQQARARHQASLKARTLAEQTLDAEQKKFALGSSTIFLVIQAQRDLAQAQAAEVAALAIYSRARNQLDLSTGQTLTTNNVSVDEAVRGEVNRPPSALPPE
ncbi:MAG: TolC family protein [Acidobacteria bacterium]|nr:TolC family protein [Acidobacteriota bacterium]